MTKNITVSCTKGGLRISWEPGAMPFKLGDRVGYIHDGAGMLRLSPDPKGMRVYQAFNRLALRFSKTEIGIMGPVNATFKDGVLRLGNPGDFVQTAPRAKHHAATVTVDGLKRTLTSARDIINKAKDELGDDMNITVVEGKLRIILMMEI